MVACNPVFSPRSQLLGCYSGSCSHDSSRHHHVEGSPSGSFPGCSWLFAFTFFAEDVSVRPSDAPSNHACVLWCMFRVLASPFWRHVPNRRVELKRIVRITSNPVECYAEGRAEIPPRQEDVPRLTRYFHAPTYARIVDVTQRASVEAFLLRKCSASNKI